MKKLVPNIKSGGQAKPIGDNLYYMSGRKHSQGGIDIGDTLEVEGGEIVQTTPKEVKVFSAQPILNGNSPAKLVMGGANPNKVFKAQEQFKDMNGLNDDGTTKFACGGRKKKVNGGSVVTVNGNVVNRTIADIDFPSSTGGRKKAALGTRNRLDDLFDWVDDKDYERRKKKVDERNADKTNRARRTNNLKEEGLQEVYSNGRVKKVPINDPNESSLYRKAMQFNTTKRELPDIKPDDSRQTYRVGNKVYKKGETFDYKGKTYKVEGRNKAVPYTGNNKSNIDQDVKDAAKRDAKGARTDYRSMLEVPTFDMDFKGNVPKSNNTSSNFSVVPANSFDVETPIESTSTAKPVKSTSTAPRRGSGNAKSITKPSTKPIQQSTSTINNKPKFVDLKSMMQGLPTANNNLPTKLEQRPNANVPDVISSPKKRLALFDKLDTNDIIGLGANLAGSIASGISTRKQLNKMEAPSRPNPIIAQRMKTNFNINPQLGEIEENTNRMINDIGANTSSSRTRLQRVQRARNSAQYAKNNLRGQKENIETQLINQDRMNRQQVSAANTAQYNAWRDKTTQFQNSIREQRASSLNNMFSGINAGIQDMVGRIENRRNYKNTLAMYDATHPNVDKRLFTSKGLNF